MCSALSESDSKPAEDPLARHLRRTADSLQRTLAYITGVRELVHRWKTGEISAQEAMQLLDQMGTKR